jgi:cardiolipin synthase A/B
MKVVLILLLIIIWLFLDFILGRKKHRKTISKKETSILHGDLDIFPHGKELFADYFNEIKQASKHVHVLFYIVKDDEFTRRFYDLLTQKALEGVEVRLLLDRLGSIKATKKVAAELREAGVKFAFSDPVRWPFLFYTANVRNHRKITVIDGSIGYLGGFNIGNEYIDESPKLSPWRDYHLKILGEGVPFLQSEFLYDWKLFSGEDLFADSSYFPALPKGSVRHQFVPTEAGTLEGNFLRIIEQAQESIIIGTPYFIPSNKILHALINKAHQGISIKVLVPYTADHFLVQEASYRYLRRIIKEGIKVYQFQNGFYHAKTIVIDDKLCDVGTANFDKRSLFLNKEMNCYIYDRDFIARVRKVLQQDILDSKLVTLEDLNKPNLFRSIKEGMAWVISFFL